MEAFTKLDCGCYIGFDVYHKPMWGKKCPLHEAAPDMYEALGALMDAVRNNKSQFRARVMTIKALAKAEGRGGD